MKLIGSVTSPFVRRVRCYLELHGHEYSFEVVDVFSDRGQETLSSYGPLRRVPILINNEDIVFDSTLIIEYLMGLENQILNISQKMLMKLIDEANDSAVHLFQLKRMNIDINCETRFAKNHQKRLYDTIAYLDGVCSSLPIDDVQSIWLFSLLDWLNFREILSFDDFDNLKKFYDNNQRVDFYSETDPRLE